MHAAAHRLLIAGHLHLDGVLRDLASEANLPQETIRDAPLTAFERLIEAALEHDVDALLMTGKLFDRHPTLRAAALFRDGMETLHEEGIPTIYAGPQTQVIQHLQAIGCWPSSLQVLPRQQEQSVSLPGGKEEPFSDLVISMIQHNRLENDNWRSAHIGIFPEQFGHLSEERAVPGDHHFSIPLVISSAHERTMTERVRNTIAHSPGSLQALRSRYPGVRSATLCQMTPEGTVELESVPTSVVVYENLDLNFGKEITEESLYENLHESLDQTLSSARYASTDLCQLSWKIRVSPDAVSNWSSERIEEFLQIHFPEWKEKHELTHRVSIVPQLSGASHHDSHTMSDEFLEEEMLRLLSEESRTALENSTPLSDASTNGESISLPFSKLQREWETSELCHRAAELGLQAMQKQQGKAG